MKFHIHVRLNYYAGRFNVNYRKGNCYKRQTNIYKQCSLIFTYRNVHK